MPKIDLAEKRQEFEDALKLFVERISEDRNILAAVLVGSISDETIWWKETIHLWVIEADGVTKRLKSDGNDERIFRTLVEEGINVHAELIPRSRFKLMVEGSSRTAFSCNFFERRELVYCDDPSIQSWFDQANTAAVKDQQKELLATTTWAIHAYRHTKKLLEIKEDLDLAKQCVVWAAHSIAAMEIVRQGEVYEEQIIYRAIESEPELFQVIYLDVIAKRPTKKLIRTALDAVNDYLEDQWEQNLKPLLHYLKKQNRVVPLSEMSEHFAYTQLYPGHLESACEWLEERGHLEKLSSPFKLTKKSRIDVEEPAYLLLQ
jgi:hypothetical protein